MKKIILKNGATLARDDANRCVIYDSPLTQQMEAAERAAEAAWERHTESPTNETLRAAHSADDKETAVTKQWLEEMHRNRDEREEAGKLLEAT